MNIDSSFQLSVAANQRLGKPAFIVRTIDGSTVDLFFERAKALAYRAAQRDQHLYEVYERSPLGFLHCIRPAPRTGFLCVDLCSKIIGARA